MQNTYHRHDISDETWELLENHLPGRKGTWGGNARDNRQFINAVFWILRTGAPWRDLPPDAISMRIISLSATLVAVSPATQVLVYLGK